MYMVGLDGIAVVNQARQKRKEGNEGQGKARLRWLDVVVLYILDNIFFYIAEANKQVAKRFPSYERRVMQYSGIRTLLHGLVSLPLSLSLSG